MNADDPIKMIREADADLTNEGLQEFLSALRQEDPTKTRQVERALHSLPYELFPRRIIPSYQTSQGTRARLQLLPENPHLSQDVDAVRRVLEIPEGFLDLDRNDERLLRRKRSLMDLSEDARRTVINEIAQAWMRVHAGMRPVDSAGGDNLLSADERALAKRSALSDLDSGDNVPDWLRVAPANTDSVPEPAAPLDRAAAMLVERHRLPVGAVMNL